MVTDPGSFSARVCSLMGSSWSLDFLRKSFVSYKLFTTYT
jgi:hypothetical protein